MKILGPEEFDLVISDIKTLFKQFKIIKLKFNDQTRKDMMIWFIDVVKENKRYTWEKAIKSSLNPYLTISYNCANQFLKEELLLNDVSEKESLIFRNLLKISYFSISKDMLFPSLSFGYGLKEFQTRRWLKYILENSSSEGIRKYNMMSLFDGAPEQQLSNVQKYLNERIEKILEEELKTMNESLNNYIDGLSRKFC